MRGRRLRISYLLAAVALLLSAVIGLILSRTLWASQERRELDANESAIVTRVLASTSLSGENVWMDEISSGRSTLNEFVRHCFTGTTYLLSGKDDAAFASDLSFALYGSVDQSANIAALLSEQSRVYVIESLLYSLNTGYSPAFSPDADAAATRVLAVNLEDPIHDEENFAFGIRKVGGTITISGDQARTDFYVDGNLKPGQLQLSSDSGESSRFSLLWDTRREVPGEHSVQVLLRTSDGRGTILTGGRVMLPEFLPLINDGVQMGTLKANDSDVWYNLDAMDRNAYVNFVNASGDLLVTMYDGNGNKIGTNDLPGLSVEILRGKKQEIIAGDGSDPFVDPPQNMFYVRVQKGKTAAISADITYLMVQSKNVARDSDGNYYAVVGELPPVPTPYPSVAPAVDILEETISLKDNNSNVVSLKRSEITILPINGCLSSLAFRFADGSKVPTYPLFAPEEQAYGYVDAGSNAILQIEAVAAEGYAAKVEILAESSAVNGIVDPLSIPIAPSRNIIRVRVTDFDGIVTEYPLYYLSGSDSEGYDVDTLVKFPASYRSGLWLMHNLAPNYRFVAVETGVSWTDLMAEQDKKDRSLVSDTYSPGWVKDGSPVYDGSSWRSARTEVVSYFLDPRNFFDPVYIFQFEKLSFDINIHTIDGVRSIVKNSFLEAGDPDFAQILLSAGQDAGISPYFLASRIIQEMGRQGQSMLSTGTLPGYEGYYNFYNIGSTPNPEVENGALINGAKYAMWGKDPQFKDLTPEEEALLLPWTTPDLAIRGGAMWIAGSYVDIGQDTLYFQKFDVINNEDGLFKHQYAQNVQMAYSESARYYRAYLSQNMIGEPFVFEIPVYSNMPDAYGMLPPPI